MLPPTRTGAGACGASRSAGAVMRELRTEMVSVSVADLQRDGAIPVPRVAQLEFLLQRAEAGQRRRQHVLAGRARLPNWNRPAASVGAVCFALVGILERDRDARHHRAGRVVERRRISTSAAPVLAAQRRGRQRDGEHQRRGRRERHGAKAA